MKRIFRFKEAISLLIAVCSATFFFTPEKLPLNLSHYDLSTYSALLNIIICILGVLLFSTLEDEHYLIKRVHGEYNDLGISDLSAIGRVLAIDERRTKYFVERTNAVIGQLVSNIYLFLWPLIIFYAVNIVKDSLHYPDFEEYGYVFSFAQFHEICPEHSHEAFWFLVLSAIGNIFNFLSGVGLWVCFTILYQKTMDADNRSTLNTGIYYFLLFAYITAYIVFIGTGMHKIPIRLTMLAQDLVCGIFNCVAMILFFNRLVQVLYFYQTELKTKLLDKFYFFIATILLPIYACFQVFFALFDQMIGETYLPIVKSTVFFVCFIGKLFLVLFMYSFIKIKWLQTAILTLLAYEYTPMEIARNVSSVSNSIDLVGNGLDEIDKECPDLTSQKK